MKIGFYKWSETDAETRARLLTRGQADIGVAAATVAPILDDVRHRGDAALLDCASRFDKAALKTLAVTDAEFEEADRTLSTPLKQAIDHCIRNVRRFHEEQMRRVEPYWMAEIEPGVFAGEQVSPVSSVGLYVPGGKNQFPSSVYMLAVPAVVAGVSNIVMMTPPRPDGSVGNALLYAAQKSGVKTIFKVGGAQAIAALAYGTQTIPAVKKVLGPCSPYGAAAKQLLANVIDPGMPAGPSEAIVLCDGTADPHNTILDVLNEAEHGPDSAGLLVTHDKILAEHVQKGLTDAIAQLPEPQRGWLETNMAQYGGIVLTDSLEDSIAFCNLYAAEHLLLKVANPDAVLPKLKNAGEILIGENTPFSLGNYATGVNHVLPTGGMAHSHSCTSVWDFLKRTSLSKATAEGFNALSNSVSAMTDYEGFPAHGNAVRQRKVHNI